MPSRWMRSTPGAECWARRSNWTSTMTRASRIRAVQGVSKLLDQDHVAMLVGAYSSENTKAIINPVTMHQVPLIIPTATADNILDSKSTWVFRICADANDYARATI